VAEAEPPPLPPLPPVDEATPLVMVEVEVAVVEAGATAVDVAVSVVVASVVDSVVEAGAELDSGAALEAGVEEAPPEAEAEESWAQISLVISRVFVISSPWQALVTQAVDPLVIAALFIAVH